MISQSTRHRFQEVAAEVVSVVDWGSLGMPKGHGTLPPFRALAKRLWFESLPDLQNLYSVSLALCAYGFWDRARQMGLTLAGVPNGTPHVAYLYIHPCFTLPCCFLERAGDMAAARPLRELALNSPGERYWPGPRALDGSMLNNFFNDPQYDRRYHAGWLLSDIKTLSLMWVLGSTSKQFTKQRISELIDVNLAELYSIPKWQPWQQIAAASV